MLCLLHTHVVGYYEYRILVQIVFNKEQRYETIVATDST